MKAELRKLITMQTGLVSLSESSKLGLTNTYAVAHNIRVLEPIIDDFNSVREKELEKLKKGADDDGNVENLAVEKMNTSLEKVLGKEHSVELLSIDMSDMTELDVPAKTVAQVIDLILPPNKK